MISAVNSLLTLEKWINSDLLSLNCTAFSSAHVNTVFTASYSTFAFSAAVFSDIYSVTSLIELSFCTSENLTLILENKNLI